MSDKEILQFIQKHVYQIQAGKTFCTIRWYRTDANCYTETTGGDLSDAVKKAKLENDQHVQRSRERYASAGAT